MYRPPLFAVDDIAILQDVIRRRVFATVAAVSQGGICFAYAPVVLDTVGEKGTIRFHLARGNAMSEFADGVRIAFSFVAADAYVSPDWYRTIVTVPTWNYIAVEAEGVLRRTKPDELRQLVVDLSAQEEAHLLPKPPWMLEKIPEERVAMLLNGIVGFAVELDRLEGKFKLSQDKNPDDMAGVAGRLNARGDDANRAVAAAMYKLVKGIADE
jgi:transcriptional regulator